MNQLIKSTNVKNNRYTCVFTQRAVAWPSVKEIKDKLHINPMPHDLQIPNQESPTPVVVAQENPIKPNVLETPDLRNDIRIKPKP